MGLGENPSPLTGGFLHILQGAKGSLGLLYPHPRGFVLLSLRLASLVGKLSASFLWQGLVL